MHTTSQKKKMTIPGIAYPPIVLARTMAPGYPDPPEIFRHEKNQNLYLERSVPAAPLARHNHLPRGRPDTGPAAPADHRHRPSGLLHYVLAGADVFAGVVRYRRFLYGLLEAEAPVRPIP